MWLKVKPDVELLMEVPLQGVGEMTRDSDLQLYEDVVKEALVKKLGETFPEEDIKLASVSVGVAREKYAGAKAA